MAREHMLSAGEATGYHLVNQCTSPISMLLNVHTYALAEVRRGARCGRSTNFIK